MSGILLAHRHGGAKTGIVLPNIGDAWLGGYFGGVMDATQSGAIPAADYYKTGQRFALIDLGATAQSSATKQYKTSNDAATAQCSTVWNGLGATQAMIAAGAAYPAAQFAAGITVPTDGASQAYIPAMWELLAMYWYFKTTADNNATTADTTSTFPGGTVNQGYDPAASPQRAAFTTTVPAQTSLTAWKTGGAQAFTAGTRYATSTEYSSSQSWDMFFTGSGDAGSLFATNKTFGGRIVRPVRRLVLS